MIKATISFYKILCSFLFVLLALSACNENVLLKPEVNVLETEQEQNVKKLTPNETFTKLRGLFLNPMLSGNLKKLQQLTETKDYLDFLSQEYPVEKPFQTFDAFLETVPPDSERYLLFFKKFIENLTDKDIAIIHQMVREYRNINALQYDLLSNPNAIARIHEIADKESAILENVEVQEWLKSHFENLEMQPPLFLLQTFVLPLKNVVIQIEKEDANRIQQPFDEHGKDDGTIWLAILEPALTGQILNDFTDTEVFLNWIKGEFFPDKPLEIPPEALEFLQ